MEDIIHKHKYVKTSTTQRNLIKEKKHERKEKHKNQDIVTMYY